MPDTLFYQPQSGISGDMHLGALVDLGVPVEWLRQELSRLSLSGEYTLTFEPRVKMGISGTYARVQAEDQHDHRHHSTIVRLITEAGFSPAVQTRALDMFQRIAVAEAKIHNIDIEKVHFHEVGAIDSIVDIVGAALCIEYFEPTHVLSTQVEVGGGYVDCAHGRFPVPAPATQEMLSGTPLTYGRVDSETTTPTGAAILAANVTEFQPGGTFTLDKVGYGIGHKDFVVPNVLRVALGSYQPRQRSSTDTHLKIEANIDDMSAEAYTPLMQALFDAGAVDVYLTPIVMKKGRAAHTLTALAAEADKDNVANTLLNQSSSIGLRIVPFEKRVLPREELEVDTSMGRVRVKRVTQPNGRTRWKSEHEDIAAIAQQANLSYQEAKAHIDHEIRDKLKDT